MLFIRPMRYVAGWRALIGLAALVLLLLRATSAEAVILVPEPVRFDAEDLSRAMNSQANGAASAPSSHDDQPAPSDDDQDDRPDRLALLKCLLPSGGASSASGAGSAAGAAAGVVMCLPNMMVAIVDEAVCGRTAEEQALRLPDPPGTDLLRPPRAA